MDRREVLVTGYGLVAPTVMNAETLFSKISEKRSCIRQHPVFADLGFAVSAAGYIEHAQWQAIAAQVAFDATTMPRQSLLAEFVTRQALQQAGLARAEIGQEILGATAIRRIGSLSDDAEPAERAEMLRHRLMGVPQRACDLRHRRRPASAEM